MNNFDFKGLKILMFALEGLDRRAEVMVLLLNHPLAKEKSDLMGLIGGRYKREYLASYNRVDGGKVMRFYKLGLQMAERKDDVEQIYCHAVNLAFMDLVFEEDNQSMRMNASKALIATEKYPIDNLIFGNLQPSRKQICI